MPITVTTGGPLSLSSPITAPIAPTFASICDEISDDIDDATGEYGPQIVAAVRAAIRYCERDTYYFNETRDITFPTVSGQEWYDAADNTNIPTLVRIQQAFREDANNVRLTLRYDSPQSLELLADNSAVRGEPYSYTYFGQRIRIYPIPDTQPFTIRLQVGPYRLAPLATDTDSNAWLTEAYDLIIARAKYILNKNTLKDVNAAIEALNDYNDQKKVLGAETSSRNGSGYVVPTQF